MRYTLQHCAVIKTLHTLQHPLHRTHTSTHNTHYTHEAYQHSTHTHVCILLDILLHNTLLTYFQHYTRPTTLFTTVNMKHDPQRHARTDGRRHGARLPTEQRERAQGKGWRGCLASSAATMSEAGEKRCFN